MVDSDTESESPDDPTDLELFGSYQAQCTDAIQASNEIYQDYVFAKKRWRRFSNRHPRRHRFAQQRSRFVQKYPNKFKPWGKGKGKGGLSSIFQVTSAPTFLSLIHI